MRVLSVEDVSVLKSNPKFGCDNDAHMPSEIVSFVLGRRKYQSRRPHVAIPWSTKCGVCEATILIVELTEKHQKHVVDPSDEADHDVPECRGPIPPKAYMNHAEGVLRDSLPPRFDRATSEPQGILRASPWARDTTSNSHCKTSVRPYRSNRAGPEESF